MADMIEPPDSAALASLLEGRLMDWEKARKPQELKLLECYQDVMRIPREDDTNGTGAARARKTKPLFIGSTRNKVRAARAKINDALFGNGEMPFDTTPTNEQLAPYADLMEDIITDQMVRGGFKELLRTGTNTLATYGTGFMFGPFVRKETLVETQGQQLGGSFAITESKYEFDMPYFELGNTLDVYPDPESRDDKKSMGVFWVTMESKHTVKAWQTDPSYKNIEQALQGASDNGNQTGSERASQMRANVQYWFKNERIKVARYFGKVPASMVNETEDDEDSQDETTQDEVDELVDAVIIMAGGVVVKIGLNKDKNPTHRCLYEAVEHEIWGVGVAENNAPHQKVTNAAFRLFMEGKGMALLGTSSVDRSKFLTTEDFKKFPGKVYQMKPGLTADERKEAIQHHIEPDITGGWIDVIKMSEQFSDDDTAITKYTQGDDSSNLNKTATGISMIMSASSLPMKEVIQNIDQMWIEPIVECYVDWNLKYLEPETVQKIHGDKAAQMWAEIKQFGKSSFMEWKATGTSSFMQKEVLTNKIRAFSEFALSNPLTASKIDVTELLNQTWDVMEIGRESPILEQDGKSLPPEVQQQMEQLQMQGQQMQEALQKLQQDNQALQQQAQAAEFKCQQEALKAQQAQLAANEAKVMLAIQKAMDSARQEMQPATMEQPETPEPDPLAAVGPLIEAIMASAQQNTGAIVEAVTSGQEQMAQLIVQATARPPMVVQVNKQGDGSFVGRAQPEGM